MTTPTREDALAMLDSIPSDYQQVDELKARLRSYIESHTGEPMAHEWRGRFGLTCCKVCGLVRKENSDTNGCRGPVYVSLRDASPVQPALEWNGDHLEFNGVKIGNLIGAGGGGEQYHSFTVYDCSTKAMRRSDKIAEMEQRARQWLSGGDK